MDRALGEKLLNESAARIAEAIRLYAKIVGSEEGLITSVMIDAGSEVAERFYLGNGKYALTEQFFREIFLAMLKAPSPVDSN